jgi:hypothetical protein
MVMKKQSLERSVCFEYSGRVSTQSVIGDYHLVCDLRLVSLPDRGSQDGSDRLEPLAQWS